MISLLLLLLTSSLSALEQKPHELWWENVLEKEISLEVFESWLGSQNVPSRIAVREHIKQKGYSSLLDIPCGLCIDYFGFQKDGIPIDYLGMDITPKLVNRAQKMNIKALLGSIEEIPLPDKSVEICHARDILEHLDSYEKAISELIRVAKKEVLIGFFIAPSPKKEHRISPAMINNFLLYHNEYSKSLLTAFILNHPRVEKMEWEFVDKETILHVYLYDF